MDVIKDFEASSGMSSADIIAGRESILLARTLTVAVLDGTGVPDMGSSPFVRRADGLYIYTSHLSDHVKALLLNKRASFMILVDETTCKNIWARNRLKFSGDVVEILRDNPMFSELCEEFSAAHGNTMTVIKDFTDFHMLRISPNRGLLVLGFAKAFYTEGVKFDIVGHLSKS